MKITELKLELFADYFQFYIQDESASGDLSDKWTNEAVQNLLAIDNGIVGVGTARNMTVPVVIQIYDQEPEKIESTQVQTINKINECELQVTSGKIVIAGCIDYFPEAKRMELENGNYKVRIYYFNLQKLSEDQLEGEDNYLVQIWNCNKI